MSGLEMSKCLTDMHQEMKVHRIPKPDPNKIAILYQPEYTEFQLFDGTRGYGSPYCENKEGVYLLDFSIEPRWQTINVPFLTEVNHAKL